MKPTALLGLLLICLQSFIFSQNLLIDLSGSIIDPEGKGVVGAKVSIRETSLFVKTDSLGKFELKGSIVNGLVRKVNIPGGLQLKFSQGILTLLNPLNVAVTMDWISSLGYYQRLTPKKEASNRVMALTLPLDRLAKPTQGVYWLRIASGSEVSTFRFLNIEGRTGSHGMLISGPFAIAGADARFNLGVSAAPKRAMGFPDSKSIAPIKLVIEVNASGFIDKRFLQVDPVQTDLHLTLLPSTSTLKEKLQDFLGPGNTLRLSFLRKEPGASKKFLLNFVDMSEMAKDTMPIHSFLDSRGPVTSPFGAFAPSWSPDGQTLAYETGWENMTTPISRIYLQPLQGPRKDSLPVPSTNARWWTDGKDTALIWCSSGSQSGWMDSNSATFRQKISRGILTGSPEILAKGSYNGGLSKDGRYLATAFPFGVMLDRVAQTKHYFHIYPGHPKAKDGTATDSLQVCNASISSDPNTSSRMLFLDFGVPGEPTYENLVQPKIYAQHRMILIGDYASDSPGRIVDFIDTPLSELALNKTWDDPEWTNHPDFAVATTRDPNGDLSDPTNPISTQPDIYLIKLSTHESLRVFTGGNQTLPVAWIGPLSP